MFYRTVLNWEFCRSSLYFKFADTYSEGRKKLPEAQYNSDLDVTKKPRLTTPTSRPPLPPQPILSLVDHNQLQSVDHSVSIPMIASNGVPPISVTYTIPEPEIPFNPPPVSQVIVEEASNVPTGCTNNCAGK